MAKEFVEENCTLEIIHRYPTEDQAFALKKSKDWKERIIGEYWLLKIDARKLLNECNKCELYEHDEIEDEPKAYGDYEILQDQLKAMNIHIKMLELRAIKHDINLQIL